ncbi:hypothetical protein C8R44DRAFT_750421 [Mycena epipterygia]|nr:hypothetical protein C8R44DRAFT_750421 [Mycena epipterygia]
MAGQLNQISTPPHSSTLYGYDETQCISLHALITPVCTSAEGTDPSALSRIQENVSTVTPPHFPNGCPWSDGKCTQSRFQAEGINWHDIFYLINSVHFMPLLSHNLSLSLEIISTDPMQTKNGSETENPSSGTDENA